MSAVEAVERVPMPLADFLALPDHVWAEYVDGVVLMAPPASEEHQDVGLELAMILRQSLRSLRVIYEGGVRTETRRFRVPDIVARVRIGPASQDRFPEQVPFLVGEVLSPSTRDEDVFRKGPEYLRAGIQQYWILDRATRSLTVLGNAGSEWETLLVLTDDGPSGEVEVGDHGIVKLDLRKILDPE